ncbi:diguanylate cyclase domain-containing protein [Mycobacterium sp.]|uniref:GGDEF domain-containing protein n=1 Tax=Mycobacterium sp. TaxID=1785 RepID=UPI003A88D505
MLQRPALTSVRKLWRQGDQFDWLSGYIAARGVSGATRALIATISASLVLCLIALLSGWDGPRGPVPVAMTWTAIGLGTAGCLLWIWRWPSRAQSIAFAAGCSIAVALACLAHPNPLAALIGCIAFATFGAYIAFFHRTDFVLYNFALAAVVVTYEAARLAVSGHPSLAAVDFWLVVEVNIALPLAIGILVRALAGDLLRADRDPLTGLLNRRAFLHKALGMILARKGEDAHLIVLTIDLDDFKSLNDERGHAAGDKALVQVAHALQTAVDDHTVTARSGGEEFLAAGTFRACEAESLAAGLCRAIAESNAEVTASVGAACTVLHSVPPGEHQEMLEKLVTASDSAMYRAKRLGGNQFYADRRC